MEILKRKGRDGEIIKDLSCNRMEVLNLQKEHVNEEYIQKINGLSNSKSQDSSSKIIFDNPILFSQFLKDYIPISIFEEVQPEDIEDVTERYVHMFVEERNSDIVKRVQLKNMEMPFFLVSLVEHKSSVDYNVAMQILRYMVFIWEDYEKEKEREHKGISKTKGFRYPPILPIIYYTGSDNWTAGIELKERILLSDILEEYIPNFKGILMQLKNYSNEQLMEKHDELSIILMINKLQKVADFTKWKEEVGEEYLKEVTKQTPEYLLGLIAHMVEILLLEINIPKEEAEEIAETIKERKMAGLFDHFEKIDIQAVRKEIEKEREEVARERVQVNREREEVNQEREEVNQEREEVNQEREKIEQERQKIYQEYLELYQEMGLSEKAIEEKLIQKFPKIYK